MELSFKAVKKIVDGKSVWGVQLTGDGWLPTLNRSEAKDLAFQLNTLENMEEMEKDKRKKRKAREIFNDLLKKRADVERAAEATAAAEAAAEWERTLQAILRGM